MEKTQTAEEAQAEARLNDQRRADQCMREVQAILTKYNCMLHPIVTLQRTGIKATVEIETLPILPPDLLVGS